MLIDREINTEEDGFTTEDLVVFKYVSGMKQGTGWKMTYSKGVGDGNTPLLGSWWGTLIKRE